MATGLFSAYRDASTWDGRGADPLEEVVGVASALTLFPDLIALGALGLSLFLVTRPRTVGNEA